MQSTVAAITHSKLTRKNLFNHPDTHAILLDILLTKTFGPNWLGWDPTTIVAEITAEFKQQVSELSYGKINAVKTMHLNEAYWTDWEAFVPICLALNDEIPSFTLLVKPSIGQCMSAADTALILRKEEYSHEVGSFIACLAIDEGIDYLPAPLDFAEPYLAQPKYKCLDCGNVSDLWYENQRCESCTAQFEDEHPFNGKPAEGVSTSTGRNIEVFFKVDPAQTKALWDKYQDQDVANVKEEDIDEPHEMAFYKLMLCRRYVEWKRSMLESQVRELL
jgi:hypothetical protein